MLSPDELALDALASFVHPIRKRGKGQTAFVALFERFRVAIAARALSKVRRSVS
jgi:hypothetical protein